MVRKHRKYGSKESSPITKRKLRNNLRKGTESTKSQTVESDVSDCLFMTESPPVQQPPLPREETYKKAKFDQKLRSKTKYDDIENYTESQSFLAMIAKQNDYNKRATKVTKEFLQKFTQDIGDHTDNLKNKVQNLNLTSVKADTDFLISFKDAFTISHPSCSRQDSISSQKFVFSSLLSHYQDLISKAQHAVELFESVNQRIAAIEAGNFLTSVKWDKEVIEAENLLKLGRQVGIERYNFMIQGDKMMKINVDDKTFLPSSPSSSKFLKPALVDQLLYQSDRSVLYSDVSWGAVAQKQLRALKKLAKVSKSS